MASLKVDHLNQTLLLQHITGWYIQLKVISAGKTWFPAGVRARVRTSAPTFNKLASEYEGALYDLNVRLGKAESYGGAGAGST